MHSGNNTTAITEDNVLCRQCKATNPEGSRFCEACGGGLAAACLRCEAPLGQKARFCSQCGLGTQGVPPPNPEPAPSERGERKRVTVLFADIHGSTELIRALDPEQAMDRLDPVLAQMGAAVRRFGGTVNRVMGDGIMALFGAPLSQENHAACACLAARAMLDPAAADPACPKLRVGIHSGSVVVRQTGSDPADIDVTGSTAHLASRMEQLARPGTACLTAGTANLARGFVDLAPLGAVSVRGFDQPVEMFELLAATDRSSWDIRSSVNPLTPFAGRAVELAILAEAKARAARGRGQVVTIVAEAGMGKSRLLQEFLRSLPEATRVLHAAGLASDTGTSLNSAANLLRSWLGVGNATGVEETERRLKAALALSSTALAVQAAPLRAFLDLPAADAGWDSSSAGMKRQRMIAAVNRVMLSEALEQLVVVVVEDLHWVDAASIEALAGLAQAASASRLLLLITTRPEAGAAGWLEGDQRSWWTRISLMPLPAEAAEQMLNDVMGDAPELAPLRRQLIEQTGGTPFFLEEIARSLRETGLLTAQAAGGRILAASLDTFTLPDTVQAVLAARIDNLPPRRRTLLQTASVIGKDVPRMPLSRLTDLGDALQAELDLLRDAEFLFEVHQTTGLDYTFKHALTQAVAYDSLLLRRRQALHARVLGLLQEDVRHGSLAMPERMALHAMRGQVWDEAARLSHAAGLRANARSAWREAVGFFEWALAALAQLTMTDALHRLGIDVRLALRVSLAALGEFKRIVPYLDEARALAEASGDHARLAPIDVSACTILTNLGQLDDAILAGGRALSAMSARGDGAGILTSGFALGQAHWFRGAFDDAATVLDTTARHARGPLRLSDLGTTGTASVLALVCLAKTHAITGAFDAARTELREAQAIATVTGKPYDRSYVALADGFILLQQDDTDGAVAALEQALGYAQDHGISLLVPSVARYLGPALVTAGKPKAAATLLQEALRIAEAGNLIGLTAWCRMGWAGALPPGDPAAEDAAVEALSLATRHGYRPIEAQGLRMLARLRLHQGRAAEAAALLHQSAALAGALGMAPERARARYDLAQAMTALSPLEQESLT
jgi:class 3 adenylate cyclase/tetratricopeptide (TPR) repeat protein